MKRACTAAALVLLLGTFLPAEPMAVQQEVRRLVPVRPSELPATLARAEESTTLGIPPRNHDPQRPPEGWCGETAIQEAMLFHGAYWPQKLINAAGRPRHPDLYARDVPVALKGLGMEIRIWPDGNPRPSLDGFLAWLRKQLDAGVPVLCGVKINPTQHPEWGLDHFVLAVGHTRDSITFNTTWGHRVTRTDQQLRSTREKGFAFENRYRSYYGIAVPGPAERPKDCVPVRLFVQQEDKDRMVVIVKCEGLVPGARYAIYRLSSADEKDPRPVHVFKAAGSVAGFRDVIDKSRPAIYRCGAIRQRR